MKKTYIVFALLAMVFGLLTSCSEEKLNSHTIFPDVTDKPDHLEEWIADNYLLPYNVDFQYKLDEIETDRKHNLVPADSAKSAKLAIIIKYMWFDAYNEVVGQSFIKENSPRVLMLLGNPAYNSNGTETLATAEGGYKVTLYRVNSLTNKLLRDYKTLNYLFFHTMHHEFTHILNQRKPYDTAFDLITPSTYISGEWYQHSDEECLKEGFITNYARSEPREDFAELMSIYITDTPEQWNDRLKEAGTKGAELINQKITFVKAYMQNSWNVNLDQLRDVILRRGESLSSLNLETLN